jgi:hypothetical protein
VPTAYLTDILAGRVGEMFKEGTPQLSMQAIIDAAKIPVDGKKPLNLEARKINPADLLKLGINAGNMVIAHLDRGDGQGHFVVITDINVDGKITYIDNYTKNVNAPLSDLKGFNGTILVNKEIFNPAAGQALEAPELRMAAGGRVMASDELGSLKGGYAGVRSVVPPSASKLSEAEVLKTISLGRYGEMKPGDIIPALDFVVNLMKCRTEPELLTELGVTDQKEIETFKGMDESARMDFVMRKYTAQLDKVTNLAKKGVFDAHQLNVELAVLNIAKNIYITRGALEEFNNPTTCGSGNIIQLSNILLGQDSQGRRDKLKLANLTAAAAFEANWNQEHPAKKAEIAEAAKAAPEEESIEVAMAKVKQKVERKKDLQEEISDVIKNTFGVALNVDPSAVNGDIERILTDQRIRDDKNRKAMSPLGAYEAFGRSA